MKIHSLSGRVESGKASVSSLETKVLALEGFQSSQAATASNLQLHLEELADRSCRNNLRLWGIPEATGSEDLVATVTVLFHKVLETLSPSLELDRVNRTPGPRSSDPDRPRDVLCRLHRYQQKELILCRAWEHRDAEFDGTAVKILPDPCCDRF